METGVRLKKGWVLLRCDLVSATLLDCIRYSSHGDALQAKADLEEGGLGENEVLLILEPNDVEKVFSAVGTAGKKQSKGINRVNDDGVREFFNGYDLRAEVVYEEKCVKYLLDAFKLESGKWDLLGESYQETGERKLTLERFCRHYGNFPLHLQSLAAKISDSDRLHFVLGKFDKILARKWLARQVEARETDDRPLGLIVKWPFVPHGLLLHQHGTLTHGDGTRLVWQSGRVWLYAEPLGQFVAQLRKVWSPE